MIVDAKILGSLQGQAAGTGLTQLVLLLAAGVLKLFFSWRTYSLAGEAALAAGPAGEKII